MKKQYEEKSVTLAPGQTITLMGDGYTEDSIVDHIWLKNYAFRKNGEIISKAARIVF